MNAPELTVMSRNIDLELLHPSKTNPRKRFNEDKLNELAASIKTQGVLQPLLVRRMPFDAQHPDAEKFFNHYEIVAGERRYRAAKLTDLIEVPCFVRELTDLQVLHAQVIENLQRDDLHPLEEAEGYEKLMKEHGATADSLAAEIGKSKAYIYARLKLCDLCTEARTAFFSNELDASTALLIARIPVQKLQIQAVKKITEKSEYDGMRSRKGDKIYSYRAAREILQNEYMTDLSTATFPVDDATLLVKAGACSSCLKRTGNQPELFDDVNSKDVCTDTVCFAMKRTAHILRIQKEAEEKGHAVLIGKEAKKIFGQYDQSPKSESGLVRLDSVCRHDPENRTWEEVLSKKLFEPAADGKPPVQKVIVENVNRNHELIPTVNIEQATKALREAGFEIRPAGSSFTEVKRVKEDPAKIQAQLDEANAYRMQLYKALHGEIETDITQGEPVFTVELFRILAEHMIDELDEWYGIISLSKQYLKVDIPDAEMNDIDEDGLRTDFFDSIPGMTPQQHLMLIIDCLMIGESETDRWDMASEPEMMIKIAKALNIDAGKIKKSASKPQKAIPAAQAQEEGAADANAKPKAKAKRKAAVAA
jgi:ParB/RepB/Spo0J family partition protein